MMPAEAVTAGSGKRQIVRWFPRQYRDRVFELSPLKSQVDKLRSCCFKLGLCQGYITLRCNAAVKSVLSQLNISLVRFDGGVQESLRRVTP